MRSVRNVDTRIELIRVVGALAVFTYHFMGDVEAVIQPSFAAAPTWVAIRELSGPYCVTLFIIVSGIVFSWSWARSEGARSFVRRRLSSLFPLYWWVALPLIALALVAGRMPTADLWKVPVWLSGLGIVSPLTVFPVADGWWYMTLALQLVLVFPVLRVVQDRIGDAGLLVSACAVTVISVWLLRGVGLRYATIGFVGSRLLEFAIGLVIGRRQAGVVRSWPRASTMAVAACAVAIYAVASGNSVWNVVLAPATVVLLIGLVPNADGMSGRWLIGAGGLSYAFYLSHSPWAKPLLTGIAGLGADQWLELGLSAALSLAVACVIAWGFLASFMWATTRLRPGIVPVR
jgi:peptidoglycan/LPS O-acetylase OafA/YrhL